MIHQPLKVLQVGSALFEWGGIDRWIIGLMKALRDRGHEIHLTCGPDTYVRRHAKPLGFHCPQISVRSQQDWRALIPYIRLLRREKYDVVHTHYSVDFIVPAVAARLCKVPAVIMTRHMAWSWKGWKRKMYGDWLYDRIIAVAEAVRQPLLEGGIAPEKVVTVLNGVELGTPQRSREAVRNELGLREDQIAVGMFSRVIKEKGHRLLLQALEFLPSQVVAVIVGAGEDLDDLKLFARARCDRSPDRVARERGRLGQETGRIEESPPPFPGASLEKGEGWVGVNSDRVIFTGYVEDVESYMLAMDIVAAPSLWPEPFPSALLEPMMLGLPVVASRVGGIPEMVKDGETGILIPRDDVPALASTLTLLAHDPDRRKRLGAAALLDTRARFSTAKMAEGVEAVYRATLARKVRN